MIRFDPVRIIASRAIHHSLLLRATALALRGLLLRAIALELRVARTVCTRRADPATLRTRPSELLPVFSRSNSSDRR